MDVSFKINLKQKDGAEELVNKYKDEYIKEHGNSEGLVSYLVKHAFEFFNFNFEDEGDAALNIKFEPKIIIKDNIKPEELEKITDHIEKEMVKELFTSTF